MAASVKDRNTNRVPGIKRGFPLEAATKVNGGTIATVNAAGNLTPGVTSAALRCVGVAETSYDNSAGAAGALMGETSIGVWGPWGNATSGADQITAADIGTDCFIVDDQTVARVNGSGTRSIAGKVWSIDAGGVWVKFA